MDNNLKIIKASIENFQGIEAREVDFGGRSAIIIGKPGSGKSSLINAITSPIDKKSIPTEPVKKGEESSRVEIELAGSMDGKPAKYTIGVYFNAGSNKGQIVVHDEHAGKIPKGQVHMVLKHLFENFGFDIMKFINLGKTDSGNKSAEGVKKQIEVIKSIMDQKSADKLDKIDSTKSDLKEDQRKQKSIVRDLETSLEHQPFTQEEIKKYSEKIDIKEIENEFNSISDKISTYDRNKKYVDEWVENKKEIQDNIKENKRKIAELEVLIKNDELKIKDGEDKFKEAEEATRGNRPSSSDISTKLSEANQHNANVESVNKYREKLKKLEEEKKVITKIKKDIAELEKQRSLVFSDANFPLRGLAFSDDVITVNEIPIDQINTSTLIALGIRIQMLKNPNLKVMIIRDGSLLDKPLMEKLLSFCDSKNYQLLIERVDQQGEKELTIEFSEKSIKK